MSVIGRDGFFLLQRTRAVTNFPVTVVELSALELLKI